MNLNGKSLAGIALVLFGAVVFFGMFGVHLGGIVAFALGIALVCYGVKKWKNGDNVLAVIALILGVLMFGGSLPFLIGLLFAVICIYFGWKLMRKEKDDSEPTLVYDGDMSGSGQSIDLEKNFDTEWRDFLYRQHHKDDER